MTHGFRVTNSSGNVQIDNAFSNYAFSESGSLVFTNHFSGVTIRFTDNGVVPMVFANWDSSTTNSIMVSSITTSSFRVNLLPTDPAGASTTFRWRTYIPMSLITRPFSSHGLRINMPNGETAFRSDERNLLISSVINFTRAEFLRGEINSGQLPLFKNTNLANPFVLLNTIVSPSPFSLIRIHLTMSALNFLVFYRNGSSISLASTPFGAIQTNAQIRATSESLSVIVNGVQ